MDGPQKRSLEKELTPEPSSKRGKLQESVENIDKDQEGIHDKAKRIPRPTRNDKSGRSAGRRRGTRPEGGENEPTEERKEKKSRLSKRACALLIGFSGTGYYGMQV
jgi:hypothetical protein